MPSGLHDSKRLLNDASRGSSFCGILTLLKLRLENDFNRTSKVIRQVTYSVRSMISKPFVQRIAIFAFRKMRSKASDGKKKSYSERSANQLVMPLNYVLDKHATTQSACCQM